MSETRVITYKGRPELAGFLVSMLRQEGVRVEWTPPEGEERRGLGTDLVEAVIVKILVDGGWEAIERAVEKVRSSVRSAGGTIEITIEPEVESEEEGQGTQDDEGSGASEPGS